MLSVTNSSSKSR